MPKKNSAGYTNKYVNLNQHKILKRILQYPFGGLVSHWVFQSIFKMDHSERLFKIGLELFLTVTIFAASRLAIDWPMAIVVSFLVSHTINFIFNAQFWVVLKHYGLVSTTYEDYELYRNNLSIRLNKQKSILYGAVHGSRVTGKWRQSSDLDILLVRKKGPFNALKACLFVLRERSYAFFTRFPLDIYVVDSYEPLIQIEKFQTPFVIFRDA